MMAEQFKVETLGKKLIPQASPVTSVTLPAKSDVFICHATEDKEAFVGPLAEALADAGVTTFYDRSSIRWGDSLRQKIDEGLAKCRYGIVVLSKAFFAKSWPKYELDGLTERQMSEGRTLILPIWHGVGPDEVRGFSPPLAGTLAVRSSEPTENVVKQVKEMLAQ